MVGTATGVGAEAGMSRSFLCFFFCFCRLDFIIFHDEESGLVDSVVDASMERFVPGESRDPLKVLLTTAVSHRESWNEARSSRLVNGLQSEKRVVQSRCTWVVQY